MHRCSVFVSAFTAMIMFAPFAHGDEAASVKVTVDKAINAVGGKDKLLTNFRWKEKYFIGASNDGVLREAMITPPDHWWQGETDIAKGNPDRSEKTYLVWVWTLAPLIDEGSKLAPLPEIKVNEMPCAGIQLSRKDRPDIDLYFDKTTGLLAQIDWRTYHIHFSDWKEVDGFKYPSQAFVHNKDGTLHLRTEFLEIERLKATPQTEK